MTKNWRTIEFVVRIPVYADKVNKTGLGQQIAETLNKRGFWSLGLQVGRARVVELNRHLVARRVQQERRSHG